jgi:hydrogenase maturation protease
VLAWEQIPATPMRPVSGHGIGVREALQVCRKLYPEKMPEKIYLVGVEGACFDLVGAGLSPEVKTALPRALEAIVQLIG